MQTEGRRCHLLCKSRVAISSERCLAFADDFVHLESHRAALQGPGDGFHGLGRVQRTIPESCTVLQVPLAHEHLVGVVMLLSLEEFGCHGVCFVHLFEGIVVAVGKIESAPEIQS